MKILTLDTSNETCSIALLEDDKVITEQHRNGMKQHSETLMPLIKETLECEKITLDDIDLIGCGIGPGSFTGVRIAIATAKAFCDVKKIPVVGINSLEAQAYNCLDENKKDCKIISMIDARNDNVYFAVYRVKNGEVSIYKNPEAIKISSIIEFFDFNEPVYIVGDVEKSKIEPLIQAKRAKEMAQAKDVKDYEYVNNDKPLARAIGIATLYKYKNGMAGDSSTISPLYLQKPQAERQKDGEDDSYIYEITHKDIDEIKNNYEKFPNIWDYNTLKEDIENSKYFVAKQNDEVVGFIGIKTIFDEIEIMNVVTRADKRNRGIASNLLSYIIRKSSANKINLEVSEHNKVAKDLYLKFGFKQVGERKKYYSDGSNALLMSL